MGAAGGPFRRRGCRIWHTGGAAAWAPTSWPGRAAASPRAPAAPALGDSHRLMPGPGQLAGLGDVRLACCAWFVPAGIAAEQLTL